MAKEVRSERAQRHSSPIDLRRQRPGTEGRKNRTTFHSNPALGRLSLTAPSLTTTIHTPAPLSGLGSIKAWVVSERFSHFQIVHIHPSGCHTRGTIRSHFDRSRPASLTHMASNVSSDGGSYSCSFLFLRLSKGLGPEKRRRD